QRQMDEGRTDDLLDGRDAVRALQDALAEGTRLLGGGVHLPIAGNDWRAHGYGPNFVKRRAWAIASGSTSCAGKVPRAPRAQSRSLKPTVSSGRENFAFIA